jgi:hypothetical protein
MAKKKKSQSNAQSNAKLVVQAFLGKSGNNNNNKSGNKNNNNSGNNNNNKSGNNNNNNGGNNNKGKNNAPAPARAAAPAPARAAAPAPARAAAPAPARAASSAATSSPYRAPASNPVNQWAAGNSQNNLVAGAANDLFYNAASADLQTRSDVNYAMQMAPLSLEYQQGAQSIMTDALLKLKAADAAIARDLTEQTGQINTGIESIRADTLKYGADRQLDSTRLNQQQETERSRYTADSLERTSRFGQEQETQRSRYTADSNRVIGQDRNQSEERQIGLKGAEERRTLQQGTDETLRLRADARGAIRRAGARFYG